MGSADDACVLLMQRDWSKPMYPGCWESGAGGSVLKGESFLEGARRVPDGCGKGFCNTAGRGDH